MMWSKSRRRRRFIGCLPFCWFCQEWHRVRKWKARKEKLGAAIVKEGER